jgi:hypothetical protein
MQTLRQNCKVFLQASRINVFWGDVKLLHLTLVCAELSHMGTAHTLNWEAFTP